MAFTLYDATAKNFLQTLDAVGGFLERGRTHCQEKGLNLAEVVEARLAPDMLPFRFQIISVAHHSKGALEGAQKGLFAPSSGPADADYAALQALVADARAAVAAASPEAVNALVGGETVFQLGERRMPFKTEDFLMSFSLPNFYFHATTAYDILRHRGVPLGKRDFLGRLRMKT